MRNQTTILLSTLALSACGSHTWGVAPALTAAPESEPNNSIWSANDFGVLDANGSLTIAGHVDGGGFGDVYDGFEFAATAPCAVQFTLTAQTPGADLDVALIDPWTQATLWEFQSPYNPETGSFEVFGSVFSPQSFQLVVTSFSGSSNYLLHVDAAPIYGATLDPSAASSGLDASHGIQVPAASAAPSARSRVGAFQDYLEPAAGGGQGDSSQSLAAGVARGLLLELDADGSVTGIAEAAFAGGIVLAGESRDPWGPVD